MEISYDEDDGIEDSNNEPRRSPRQMTANNHQLTMAPLYCTKRRIKDGWLRTCKNPYQKSRCSTGCTTQTRTLCSCDPGSSIVHHAMYPMCTMFYQEDKAIRVKLSIRAPKKSINRIPAMVPLTAPLFRPSKIGPIAPS
jgi:hypothetical protein